MKNLRSLFPYLARYRMRIALGILFVVGSNWLSIQLPKNSAKAIDSLRDPNPEHPLVWYVGIIIVAYILSAILRFFIRFTLVVMSRNVEYDLRKDIWSHIQRLSPSFFKSQPTGDIMARLSNDVEAVRMFPGPSLMYSIDSVVRLVIIINFLLAMSPLLTGVMLIPMPFLAAFVYLMSSRIHSRFTKVQEEFSSMTTRVQQNFSGIRVIKAYTREDHEIDLFSRAAWTYRDNQLGLAKIQAVFRPVLMFIPSLSGIIILGLGGWLVATNNEWVVRSGNKLSPGELAAFMMCLHSLVWPIMALGWVTNITQRADASMKRLNTILSEKPEIVDTEATDSSIASIAGCIEFDKVSLRYPETTKAAIKDLSLTIPEGKTYAIIGKTGSGKSSLVSMIPRLYDPEEGEIRIGGRPLKTIPLELLRKSISVAPQEPFLFSDSIRNNIRFSSEAATDEDVREAIETAQLSQDLKEFPQGLESTVGERGLTLSGGQKQRCALARAILARPKILILDDTLSAVDTATEEAILSGMRKVMKEQTTLIISHRISTVQEADQIVVLSKGRLAEQGKHHELLEQDGIYAELYRKQQLESELERIA